MPLDLATKVPLAGPAAPSLPCLLLLVSQHGVCAGFSPESSPLPCGDFSGFDWNRYGTSASFSNSQEELRWPGFCSTGEIFMVGVPDLFSQP